MLKYTDTAVTFAEIPDEITLCINISNCPIHCKDCHSKYLWKDIGTTLDIDTFKGLIRRSEGISCVCIMGGDIEPKEVNNLFSSINLYSDILPIKHAWYSGETKLSKDIDLHWFDYIKIGPYIKEKGGLDNPNTNQKLYKVIHHNYMFEDMDELKDITYKFWKNDTSNK
jgi:anaerobic ribonucleoside-triphosphate reductase activating protein